MCLCVCTAWKGHPRNDLYCVRRDVKPYSLTHSSDITNVFSDAKDVVEFFTSLGLIFFSDIHVGTVWWACHDNSSDMAWCICDILAVCLCLSIYWWHRQTWPAGASFSRNLVKRTTSYQNIVARSELATVQYTALFSYSFAFDHFYIHFDLFCVTCTCQHW